MMLNIKKRERHLKALDRSLHNRILDRVQFSCPEVLEYKDSKGFALKPCIKKTN